MAGGVASRLIVTHCEFDNPALLVAEHVKVVPAVSVEIVVEPQPLEDAVPLTEETVHVTVTLLVYHPLLPRVPEIFGVMAGGVVSRTTALLLVSFLKFDPPPKLLFTWTWASYLPSLVPAGMLTTKEAWRGLVVVPPEGIVWGPALADPTVAVAVVAPLALVA
jgi:hypothetical protein